MSLSDEASSLLTSMPSIKQISKSCSDEQVWLHPCVGVPYSLHAHSPAHATHFSQLA